MKTALLLRFLCLFQTNDAHYCYDAHTNAILRLEVGAWEHLRELQKSRSNLTTPDEDFVLAILRAGGLTDSDLEPRIQSAPSLVSIRNQLGTRASQLTLFITEQCNLRCDYCIYGNNYHATELKERRGMTWETAQAAVDLYLHHSKGNAEKAISFYGGEPLLNLEVIKQSIEYIHARVDPAKTVISITTNGSLLDDTSLSFFAAHDVDLLVSLDGPREVHDRYRRTKNTNGSFDVVMRNLEFCLKAFPDYFRQHVSINAVVSPDANISEIYRFFKTHPLLAGNPVTMSYIKSFGTDAFYCGMKQPALEKKRREKDAIRKRFVEVVLSGVLDQEPMLRSMFGGSMSIIHNREHYSGFREHIYPNGICLPGVRKLFVKPDGNVYFCEQVASDDPIGNLETGIDEDAVVQFVNDYIAHCRTTCISCWALRLCRMCCVHQYDGGLDVALKDSLCRNTRRNLKKDLVTYCSIMEKDFHALDGFTNVVNGHKE